MSLGTFSAALTRDADPAEETVLTFGPFNGGLTAHEPLDLAGASIPLFVTDREYDLVSVTLRATAIGNDKYINFRHAPSGTAIASGTVLNLVASGNDADDLTANTALTLTPIAGSNTGIPAGSLIEVNGESGLTTLRGLVITMRFRTRRSRTADSGKTFFVEGGETS